jgi:hypothetical protein
MSSKWVLLCGDAYWTQGNLSPGGKQKPSWLARLIMDNPVQFDMTLASIANCRKDAGDDLMVLASHDSSIALGNPSLEFV